MAIIPAPVKTSKVAVMIEANGRVDAVGCSMWVGVACVVSLHDSSSWPQLIGPGFVRGMLIQAGA